MNYLSLFPGYVQEKPKFMALAAAVLRQAADLITLAQSIAPGFSVGSAAGVQMDAIGESFGMGWKGRQAGRTKPTGRCSCGS